MAGFQNVAAQDGAWEPLIEAQENQPDWEASLAACRGHFEEHQYITDFARRFAFGTDASFYLLDRAMVAGQT